MKRWLIMLCYVIRNKVRASTAHCRSPSNSYESKVVGFDDVVFHLTRIIDEWKLPSIWPLIRRLCWTELSVTWRKTRYWPPFHARCARHGGRYSKCRKGCQRCLAREGGRRASSGSLNAKEARGASEDRRRGWEDDIIQILGRSRRWEYCNRFKPTGLFKVPQARFATTSQTRRSLLYATKKGASAAAAAADAGMGMRWAGG